MNMNESMAQGDEDAGPLELPAWKAWLSAVSAYLLAMLFIVAGVWKITDPLAAATRMTQALVPPALSLPAAIGFGIAETFAGVLLLVPRFRRWGAWLAGLLLVAFMIYIAAFYNALRGEDCNCFPWVKRAVGPAFFIGDAVMLLLAVPAGWWARASCGLRSATILLGAVGVFAGLSFGVVSVRGSSVMAPESVSVAGKPFALREGRVLLFFFNPECLHCNAVAKDLGKLNWGHTTILGVATQMPEFGQDFMTSNQLPGVLTPDAEALRKVFSFTDVPYAVALEKGQQRAAFSTFDAAAVAGTLRKLGFVQ